jgi:RNA polymerase sigma-70 factor, ECF subfamily
MTDASAALRATSGHSGMTVVEQEDPSAAGRAADTTAAVRGPAADRHASEVERLLAAVKEQDEAAFRALYDLTCRHLMGVAMRTCRDRGMAEDVLQEVFVQIWRRSHLYEPALGSGLAWLTVLARRRAIDAIRSSGRRARLATDLGPDILEALPEIASDPDRPAELRRLLKCLDQLGGRNRHAVLLAYYEGWSREELALHFQRPEGTIKTWLRRSLIALRACMEPP